jgi:hypothetical protein
VHISSSLNKVVQLFRAYKLFLSATKRCIIGLATMIYKEETYLFALMLCEQGIQMSTFKNFIVYTLRSSQSLPESPCVCLMKS